MSKQRRRGTAPSRKVGRGPISAPQQRAALARDRDRALTHSPRPLQHELADEPDGDDARADPEDTEAELTDDADGEEPDPWEPDDEDDDQPSQPPDLDDGGSFVVGQAFDGPGPQVDLSDIYALVVTGEDDPTCLFERPEWMRPHRDAATTEALEQVALGLSALAQWFADEKKAFLARPCAATYAQHERQTNSALLQKGLVARLVKNDPSLSLDEPTFSKIVRHAWLLWPDFAMPVKSLFERQFQLACIAELCIQGVKSWAVTRDKLEQRKKTLRNKAPAGDIASLTQVDRLLWIAKKTGFGAEPVFEATAELWRQRSTDADR